MTWALLEISELEMFGLWADGRIGFVSRCVSEKLGF